MARILTSVAAAMIGLALGGRAQATEPATGPAAASVRLKTMYNSEIPLSDVLDPSTRGIVLYFMHDTCPVAQMYLPRLKELHKEFGRKGIAFVSVYTSRGDSTFGMATHVLERDIPWLSLLDGEQASLDALNVERTCTAVVLDRDWNVRFRGPVDDQFTKGAAKDVATHHYLQSAIQSLLDGSKPLATDVPVSGCVITRIAKDRPIKSLTYHKDVLPILQQRCQECHRPGEAAPFSLLTYEDAANWSQMIAETVEERRMPPWGALEVQPLKTNLHLSKKEIETVVEWVRGGSVEGDPKDAPTPITWPKNVRWKIGSPDYEYQMPTPFALPATGLVDYQYFAIRNPFPKGDRWVTAAEMAPGNRRVVHHIQLYVVKQAANGQQLNPLEMMAFFGLSADNANIIASYAPGDQNNARAFPADYGVKIPAGHDLVMEVHYTPSGEKTTDRSRFAFQFSNTKPEHEMKSRFLHHKAGRFNIPAGEMHQRFETDYWFEKTTRLFAVRPHMHARGKNFRLEMVYPAGRKFAHLDPQVSNEERTETLISVPAYDYNWQRSYEFKEPVLVPAGAELRGIGHFDNSRFNPRNPDPTADVPWGQQAIHEMFSTRLFYEELEDES